MQEFNKISTESNFIKNLLISTYLPLIRTVRDFDYIIQDRVYVYKCNIIKCTDSGYIVTGEIGAVFNKPLASFVILAEYTFGERNDKLCTNYISNRQGYDSITHERLGKYLRSLRDMYGLNLLPLYNCFSNQTLPNHHIFDDRISKISNDYRTKVFRIPIRFNTDYTICMENLGITTFAPAFIKNDNLLYLNNTRFGNEADVTNKYLKLYTGQVISSRPNLRFKSPIKLRFDNIPNTREVSYSTLEPRKLDSKHDPRYYRQVKSIGSNQNYYVRNLGIFTEVDITQAEFNANKSLYFTLNLNGVYYQCGDASVYSASETYYTRELGDGKFTFEYTTHYASLTVQDEHGSNPLYIGQLIDPEHPELGVIKVSGSPLDQIYESIQPRYGTFNIEDEYESIVLYTYCDDTMSYLADEVYYMWQNHTLVEIFNQGTSTHQISQSIFNSNKTHYYTKTGDIYIQCTEQSVYDAATDYYVLSGTTYITAARDYYEQNVSKMIIGYDGSLENFYYINNSGNMVSASGTLFDIYKNYFLKVSPEKHTWQELSEGQFIDSTDTYIIPGKEYYFGKLETPGSYKYDITEDNCALYDFVEDNLYLLIQVPDTFDSNIVVLEGDYTAKNTNYLFDETLLSTMPPAMLDQLFTSNLKLMEIPYSKPVPFSSTLIEFLLWNAINNLDSINNNMDRLFISVNRLLGSPFTASYANYWYPKYRQVISDIGKNYNTNYIVDNLGYVTTNIEKILTDGIVSMEDDTPPAEEDK